MAEHMDWKQIREKAGPFPIAAYQFVHDGLQHTVRTVHGDGQLGPDESRHVSGQQLCLGLKDYAHRQYGLLARTVLRSWHVEQTGDFGRIVFAMIEAGMLRKTDEDSLTDFESVFEFEEAFADLPTRAG